MPADAIYRIMSQTKAITSVAIMQLFEQGKLYLDQPVGDFIPEYTNQTVLKEFNPADSSYTTLPANRKITIRDLLSHRSGIDYTAIGSDNMKAIYAKAGIPSGLGNTNAALLDKMKVLGRLPLAHQPGEKYTYGLNTDLLGCLVEVISGKTLDEYFKVNIFEPLGMKDTYFTVPLEKSSRMPKVYTENAENQIILWDPTFRNLDPNYPLFPRTYFSGGAGLSASTFDYAIFLQMLVNGGMYNGKQILGRRTIELMTSPQIALENDNFGLGFRITSKKSADLNMFSEGTYSWGGYYGTSYYVDPKEKLVVLIMTQHSPNSHGDFAQKIENIIYGSLKK
jgi:CubicO group peptidase (beta-lactamase class C family)